MKNQAIPRRNFLHFLGLIAGSIPFLGKAAVEKNSYPANKLGIFQGPTNSHSTILTAVVHRAANPVITVTDQLQNSKTASIQKIDLGFGDFIVYQILVDNLVLTDRYTLQVLDSAKNINDSRTFSSLDLTNKSAKVAIISCSNHAKSTLQSTMYSKLKNSKADAIYFIGDMVYANRPSDTLIGQAAPLDVAYDLYLKSFLSLDFYSQKELTPTFSLWDDHDTAKDNATAAHPNLAKMMTMYRSFFPLNPLISEIKTGPGASFVLEAFGFQNFFFDGRSFRTSTNFIGDAQFQWFKGHFANGSKPSWLILGQQYWQYNSINDCFQRGCPVEFNAFMQFLKSQNRKSMFIAGDVHYSQIQQIDPSQVGYPTYELTSSALFSTSAGNLFLRSPDKGQLEFYGFQNFLVLDQIQISGTSFSLDVTCVSDKSDTQFKRTLHI